MKISIIKTSKTNVTIKDISKEWLNSNINSLKQSTYCSYEYTLNKYILSNDISKISINELDRIDIVSYSNMLLSNGLSPKMINDILIIINQLMKYSSEKYSTQYFTLPYVKQVKKEMRVLSKAEQQTLEKVLKSNIDIYKLGILFSLYTGIRIGELCALKWGDINDSTVTINKTMYRLRDNKGNSKIVINPPKTNSSNRTIPLPNCLTEFVESFRSDNNYYFLSDRNKDFIEPRLMQIHFKAIAKECGLEKCNISYIKAYFCHSLRRM